MRRALCRALVEAASRPTLVFLTGDLGFMVLEPLREALGARFLNAGIAEQNMVSVAAGLAQTGLRPWVYSIAPFLYARAYEQIRNDVCLHDFPVVFVGNGGGYGYGVMGATHHALEDYGTLLCLPRLRAFVPAFTADVPAMVATLLTSPHPTYLRLGLGEEPKDLSLPAYAPWRRLLTGGGATLLAVGPLAGGLLAAVRGLEERVRPNLWVLSELPFADVPREFLADVRRSEHLVVVEEHVAQGGAGQMLAGDLLARGCAPRRFAVRAALGYVSGCYGSQQFHRAESGLDPRSIVDHLLSGTP